MKKLLLLISLVLSTGTVLAEDFSTLITNDYNRKADSLEYVLVEKFLVKDKGVFKVRPEDNGAQWDIYWQQAHAMDVIIYAYERIKDSNPDLAKEYKNYMQAWYRNRANNWGSNSTWENPFTDDMCWIGLTMYHMATVLDMRTYFTMTKTIYDKYIASRKQTDSRGTFLPWNSYGEANSGPNACTLSPACLLALRLYDHYGEEKYLEDAKLYYDFLVNNICKSDGRVEEPPLTYTQGTFGEACRVLYHVTGETKYKTKAQQYLSYAISSTGRCCDKGLLRHEGTSMDQALFKAVLIPYLVNFVLDEDMRESPRKNMLTFLMKNADTLWQNLDHDAYPAMYCNYYWGTMFNPNGDRGGMMGAMVSGASLMENVARVCNTIQAEAAGIDNVWTNPSATDTRIYDLMGRPINLTSGLKGIFIMNGKKVLVK